MRKFALLVRNHEEGILFFGTAGTLQKNVLPNELIVPVSAIRDEGTSFHYEKPGRYAYTDSEMVQANQKPITLYENFYLIILFVSEETVIFLPFPFEWIISPHLTKR